jgi:GH15 family glucan-1,4-alpha-glucosidase
MAGAIEDYALIGDMHTAALVHRGGSVDWLCLPRFDSPALFAAILGTAEHGRWLIAPADPEARATRRYLEGTGVLETVWTTSTGRVSVLDLMPVGDGRADVVRRVEGLEGTVSMRQEWVVRPGYGAIVPWVTRPTTDTLQAVAGPDRFVLRGPQLPRAEGPHHAGAFDVGPGHVATYTLTWSPSYEAPPEPLDVEARLQLTVEESRAWLARGSQYRGAHRELVERSLLTLRQLTHRATGGIVAAPTTSLPEDIGGERNWDYRYCWLRDASLTLIALHRAGFGDEGLLWRDWLLRAVAGDPRAIQIMYTVDGARDLWERELPHLPGYADSQPVRIGNAASGQHQADVLGEVMVALDLIRETAEARLGPGAPTTQGATAWPLLRTMLCGLEDTWAEPDHGIWEIRGPQRHFTHSRVLSWAAFDRGVRAVERHGLEGPVERWREIRDRIHDEVLSRGVDPARGCFVQHYDTDEVDASLLVLPVLGFVPGDHPAMLRTLEAIEQDLLVDGLALRYRTSTGVDGLSGDENTFVACSFWLVSAYVAAGRQEDAERLFERLAGMANDLGLYAEELDPRTGAHLGNFPQALSHLALVDAALDLAGAHDDPPRD